MDDLIEQLREFSQTVAVPLELPSEDILVEVEEQLLLSIPADLRQFLLEASDVVIGDLEPVTAADPRAHNYLPEVAAQAWSEGLPRDCLPICQYDGGYAAMDHQGRVAFWCATGFTEEWEDFEHWAREVWLTRG